MTVQQQPGDMPYSSKFLRKLELYIANPTSHQSRALDMHQLLFGYLAS